MGHLIFFILHLIALLFGAVFLFVTIPAHLIYGAVGSRASAPDPNAPRPDTHVRCPDCREFVLMDANVCKHCGRKLVPQPVTKRIDWTVAVAIAVTALIVATIYFSVSSSRSSEIKQLAQASSAKPVTACSVGDIKIKSMKARFVDSCRTRECYSMKGVAVMTNTCAEAIGVQIKITGLDKAGNPMSTRDLWPASVSNIPPGDYTFSLDGYLDYDPKMKRFEIFPIEVRRWRER